MLPRLAAVAQTSYINLWFLSVVNLCQLAAASHSFSASVRDWFSSGVGEALSKVSGGFFLFGRLTVSAARLGSWLLPVCPTQQSPHRYFWDGHQCFTR